MEYTNGSVVSYEIDNTRSWVVIDKGQIQRALLGWALIWVDNDPDAAMERDDWTQPPCTALVPAVLGANGELQIFDVGEIYVLKLVSMVEWTQLVVAGRIITFDNGG